MLQGLGMPHKSNVTLFVQLENTDYNNLTCKTSIKIQKHLRVYLISNSKKCLAT